MLGPSMLGGRLIRLPLVGRFGQVGQVGQLGRGRGRQTYKIVVGVGSVAAVNARGNAQLG